MFSRKSKYLALMLTVPSVAFGVVIVLNAGLIEAQSPYDFVDVVIDKEPRPVETNLPLTDSMVPQGKPPNGSTPPPPNIPSSDQRLPLTFEEEEQLKQRILQRSQVISIKASGPETKGSVFYAGNKKVQLPPDAYIEHYISFGSWVADYPCPEFPEYVIRRGNSRAWVAKPSGTIVKVTLAPGEEGTFNFLRNALPFQEIGQ